MNCKFQDCNRPVFGRGYCQSHYLMIRRGKPLRSIRPLRTEETPESRISQRYTFVPETGCCEWTGPRHPTGYGYLMFQGQRYQAHRFAYETMVGPIPLGAVLCHKCDNPPCINPDHLFIGTHKTNAEDKVAKKRHPRSNATTCKRGHPYVEGNVYTDIHPTTGRTYRRCRECNKLNAKRNYEKRMGR